MRRSSSIVLAAVVASALTIGIGAQREAHVRLFPPEDLGDLESPDRELWQQPDVVMDELNIAEASKVADIGAGGGWFTIRLARRVGPNGIVYAEDIQQQMIDSITRRVEREGLKNVRPILGTADDPRLPRGLQAVLIVDTYPALRDPVNFLRKIAASLAPKGLVGIVDWKKNGAGGPGPPLPERLDPDVILRDARQAGLTLVGEKTFLRYQYFLIFGK